MNRNIITQLKLKVLKIPRINFNRKSPSDNWKIFLSSSRSELDILEQSFDEFIFSGRLLDAHYKRIHNRINSDIKTKKIKKDGKIINVMDGGGKSFSINNGEEKLLSYYIKNLYSYVSIIFEDIKRYVLIIYNIDLSKNKGSLFDKNFLEVLKREKIKRKHIELIKKHLDRLAFVWLIRIYNFHYSICFKPGGQLISFPQVYQFSKIEINKIAKRNEGLMGLIKESENDSVFSKKLRKNFREILPEDKYFIYKFPIINEFNFINDLLSEFIVDFFDINLPDKKIKKYWQSIIKKNN